ncbi:MAG: sugar phosphate isomerase/epimerase [Planctomycetota bacterium]|nr:MAG: sugar phosphate isomerase/epimerase [Planctomycetota bacterium]
MINRRTFIQSAAALGTGAGVLQVMGQNSTGQKNQNKAKAQKQGRKWKIAFLDSLGYSSMKPAEVVKSLSKLGYEGIEWTTRHIDINNPLPGLRELADRTHDAGMVVSRLSTLEDMVCLNDEERRKRIERTVRIIEAAGQCGIGNVGTMPGPFAWRASAPKIGKNISESAAWEMVFEAHEAFGKAAKAAGVVISSEAVFGMVAHDFYTHKFMMDHLDASVNKVNHDPSHGILYGNLDVGWVIRQWGDRIAHVHLKDAVGIPERGKFIFPLLGEGLVDWKAFFKALDDIGYEGFCSVEYESFAYYQKVLKSNPEEAARISLEQVKALTKM